MNDINFNVRDQAMELVEEGIVDAKDLLLMALKYMSTDEVRAMLEANAVLDYMED